MSRRFLRQVVILWVAGLIGAAAMLPLLFYTQASILDRAAAKGLTVPVLAGLILLQCGLLLAIAVPVGLWAASRLSLRAPLSEALAAGENLGQAARPFLLTAILAGQ